MCGYFSVVYVELLSLLVFLVIKPGILVLKPAFKSVYLLLGACRVMGMSPNQCWEECMLSFYFTAVIHSL